MRTSPARTSDRARAPAGFTLIELLVVLGLMGVIMLLALPAFQNLLQSTLQQEVNRISGVIRLMRNEAVLTNTRYRLRLDLKQAAYAVERQDELGTYVVVEQPRVLAAHAFPAALEIQDLELLGRTYHADEPEPLSIVVDASGYIDPFLLHFSYDDAEYTLRVSGFTGKVELVDGHADS